MKTHVSVEVVTSKQKGGRVQGKNTSQNLLLTSSVSGAVHAIPFKDTNVLVQKYLNHCFPKYVLREHQDDPLR